MKQTAQRATTDSIRILKSATCPSLSAKSKLQFDIGCTDKSEVQIRIVGNSASGSHSRDWVALQAIEAMLAKVPHGRPITSNVLSPLFRGKSVNNQLFLFAVLVHEGFVRRSEDEKRGYERGDSGEFKERAQALIEGKGATTVANVKNKKAKPNSATKTKKPAASTKSKKSPS